MGHRMNCPDRCLIHLRLIATARVACLFTLILPVAISLHAESPDLSNNLSTLYEKYFRGSQNVHVPAHLFSVMASYNRVASINLTGNEPFQYRQIQGVYYFPTVSNDDIHKLYFYPYQGFRSLPNGTPRTFVFDKEKKTVETVGVENPNQYMSDSILGFYKNLRSSSDAVIRIDARRNGAILFQLSRDAIYGILNPKDVDSGSDVLLLSRQQSTETDFAYNETLHDLRIISFSMKSKSVLTDVTFPFTDSYCTVNLQTLPLQSVQGRAKIYFVLNSAMFMNPQIRIPLQPLRFHILIYDQKMDSLYSVWHGIDDSDGLEPLAFSYYLGIEGPYFEVLKRGKVEIYLLHINLDDAKPQKEYETVDLLWNTSDLKLMWDSKIRQERKSNSSFSPVWR